MDRGKFLRLGAAGALGVATGAAAGAGVFYPSGLGKTGRTVRVTDSEFGAKGDGRSDDGPAIRRALSDTTVREVGFPRGRGYAVDMGVDGWEPLPLRSGVRLVGYGLEGPLVRSGAFVNSRTLFGNEHALGDPARGLKPEGDDGVELDSLCILGRMDEVDLVELDDPDDPTKKATINNAVVVRSNRDDGRSEGFRMLGCRIHDWPGVAVSCNNLKDFLFEGNTISRVHRGGLILNFLNADGVLRDNVVTDVGDHAVGLNADGNVPVPDQRAPSAYLTIENNTLSRVLDENRTAGPVIAVRGGNVVAIEGNRILHGMASGVYLQRTSGFVCRQITFTDNRLENCEGGAIIARGGVQGVASRNTARNCATPTYRNRSSDSFIIDETNDPKPEV